MQTATPFLYHLFHGENCMTVKVMPDHNMILLCWLLSLQEHLEAASSCFANTENLNEQVLIQ